MSANRPSFDVAAWCGLPLVRRAYMALVVGLAVFIVTLVLLREPFRGYLAEIHISGPAAGGLNLEDAAKWLKEADPHVAVVANSGGSSPRQLIRVTFVAPRPTPGLERLDELADRWLYQYLPERLQAYRHTVLGELRNAVNTAREREDSVRQRLDELRQQQLAQLLRTPSSEQPAPAPPDQPRGLSAVTIPATGAEKNQLVQRLETLRADLAKLLGSCTEDHPQVVALRRQISALEQALGSPPVRSAETPNGPEILPSLPAGRQASTSQPGGGFAAAEQFISTAGGVIPRGEAAEADGSNPSEQLPAALQSLAAISRERQKAEHRLSDRMQELSSQPTAAEWSAEPARIVTRLGGTPRSATLALGGLLAGIVSVLMFRASGVAVAPARIESTAELATLLEIPVIGNAALLRTAARVTRRFFTTARIRLVQHLAEIIIAVAALACLASIACEPSLVWQVLADPFGTLSEVVGRLHGG